MKVLSLLEPWASLVKEKIKCVETRSWKTKYRGELYIHASKRKVTKKDARVNNLVDLLENNEFKYGHIIAKCNLVDCIYMDDEYINTIQKKKFESMCGRYTIGRYAWILDDIEILENPIETKGQLGIWNY
ncbi:MAG: ASCH domain-containing protein [Clostridia bacterium]|nr:ASCH domain-containing protein [Clostridia bacterium]MDD4387469.1 ASCH domain-containing protein [Clostridia bacterium]